jgi:hypothetical protein
MRQVTLKEWGKLLNHYEKLLETVALLSDYESVNELTEEYMQETIPTIIALIFGSDNELSQNLILEFLTTFAPELTMDMLNTFTEQDIFDLWVKIYGENKRPFALKRVELNRRGTFQRIKEVDLEKLISFTASYVQDSDTQNLPMSPLE